MRAPGSPTRPRRLLAVLFLAALAALAVAASGRVALAPAEEALGREGVDMQRGEFDCGVSVLAMLLAHHHAPAGGLERLRDEVARRGQGLSLLEMSRVAERAGLHARGWTLDPAALARAPLPLVAHYPDHYVVVDRVHADGSVEVRDPRRGRVRIPGSLFARRWTGRVLLVTAERPAA